MWITSRGGIRNHLDRKKIKDKEERLIDRIGKFKLLSKYLVGIVYLPYIDCCVVASGNGKIILMSDWTERWSKRSSSG
jgi:hypothetical protein